MKGKTKKEIASLIVTSQNLKRHMEKTIHL